MLNTLLYLVNEWSTPIVKRCAKLNQERQLFDFANEFVSTHLDVVSLDVGGTQFITSRQTLCVIEGSLSTLSQENQHFIDRDGTIFATYILPWLRHQQYRENDSALLISQFQTNYSRSTTNKSRTPKFSITPEEHAMYNWVTVSENAHERHLRAHHPPQLTAKPPDPVHTCGSIITTRGAAKKVENEKNTAIPPRTQSVGSLSQCVRECVYFGLEELREVLVQCNCVKTCVECLDCGWGGIVEVGGCVYRAFKGKGSFPKIYACDEMFTCTVSVLDVGFSDAGFRCGFVSDQWQPGGVLCGITTRCNFEVDIGDQVSLSENGRNSTVSNCCAVFVEGTVLSMSLMDWGELQGDGWYEPTVVIVVNGKEVYRSMWYVHECYLPITCYFRDLARGNRVKIE